MLDAENVERQRIGAGSDDAVFGDDAVLLAAADQFAGEEQNGALAAVDQHQAIDGGAGAVLAGTGAAIAAAGHAVAALLADDYVAGGEAFVEGEEGGGVLRCRADYRKDGDIFVGDGIEKVPVAFRFGLRSR